MRVQDVERFWQQLDSAPRRNTVQDEVPVRLHYLAVLTAIANGMADPDPAALAQAVMRGVAGPVAGECQTPEVRYVHSSDEVASGDNLS